MILSKILPSLGVPSHQGIFLAWLCPNKLSPLAVQGCCSTHPKHIPYSRPTLGKRGLAPLPNVILSAHCLLTLHKIKGVKPQAAKPCNVWNVRVGDTLQTKRRSLCTCEL